MSDAFEKKIRAVQFRCTVNLLLEQAAMAFITAGSIAIIAILTEKLFAIELVNALFTAMLTAICIAGIILVYIIRKPSRMHAAVLVDERLNLKERFSTTLLTENSKEPFALAAQKQARQKAAKVTIKKHFPLKFTSHWYGAFSAWIVLVAIFTFFPQKDILGFIAKKKQRDEQTAQKELAKAAIKEAAKPVKLAVKQLGDEKLNSELAKLDPLMNRQMPQAAKRQAIRKLGDISDQIKKLHSSTKMQAAEIANQMLKQLKGTPQGISQKLSMELAKGNFSKAADLLRQFQKQMDEGKLTEEQKKQLANQLKDMAKQLEELAKKNAELEKELEKMGLSKKLAKMDPDQLKQALQKKGLSSEQIEKLLKKASACKSACNSCSQLGAAMASAGASGASGDQLSELMDQLNAMEAMNQQMQMMQASMDEISRAIDCLGEGMCNGSGNKPWSSGSSGKFSKGSGGPGKGSGFKNTAEGGNFKTLNTKVKSGNNKSGPVVASWYFKGEQVKGKPSRDYSEVIQAGRDSAAEAISENQIPRKYEETVKKYFGGLEENSEN